MPVYLSPTVGTVDQRLRPGSPFRRGSGALGSVMGFQPPEILPPGGNPLAPQRLKPSGGRTVRSGPRSGRNVKVMPGSILGQAKI